MRDELHLWVMQCDVYGQVIMVENIWVMNIYAPNDVIKCVDISLCLYKACHHRILGFFCGLNMCSNVVQST